MYGSTITLFNYHAATGCWYPSVVSGVELGVVQSNSSGREGRKNANSFTALIHTNDRSARTLTTTGGMKSYTGPKEYANCADPEARYTFTPEQDFIYEGAWPVLTPIVESQEDEGLYQKMNNQYDGVHMIQSAEFFRLLPHFEVEGR